MTQATELRELATLLDVSSGKVGIGLPSGTPSNALVISDGVRTSAAITAGTTALEIARTGGGDVGILINKDTSKWLIGVDNSDGNAGPLRFMYGAYNAAAHPGFGTAADGLNLAYDGAVGIGTKTPSDPLHVDTIHEVVARFESNSNNGTNLVIANADATTGRKAIINLAPANNVTGVLIGAEATEDFSSSAARTADLYFTTRANGILEEKVRILSNGDVGIGTNAPVHKLDVDGAIATRQVRHSISPTLNLDFANSKELDSRITFYRDSIASYYDSKGILRYANTNTPRFDHDPATGESKGLLIEESRANIFNYTNNPERWPLMSAASSDPIVNSVLSPDGTMNATKLIVTGSDPYFYQNGLTLNGTYTFSFWIKAFGSTVGKHYTVRGANIGTSFSIAPSGGLPSEWTRITHTFTSGSTSTAYIGVEAVDNSPANGDELSIWGAQLELGSFATSLAPSDDKFISRSSVATYYDENGILRTAPVNGARYGYKYDGRKFVETGLILENAATNIFPHRADINSGFGQTAVTVTANQATAPDGSYTAKTIVDDSSTGIHRMTLSSFTSTDVETHSIFLKSYSGNRRVFLNLNAALGVNATVDLETGTIVATTLNSNNSYVDMEEVGNGWYRFFLTGTGTNVLNRLYVSLVEKTHGTSNDDSYTGDGSSGVYVWGYNRVVAYSGSSFIYDGNSTRSADVASSVAYTRAIDVAKIDNINYSDWYNTKQGSIYVDFDPSDGSGSDAVVVGIGDGTIRGFRAPWLTGANQIRLGTWSGTAYSALHYYNSVTTTNQHKAGISFSYEDQTFLSSLDGSTTAVTSSWPGVETDATTIWIGGETDTNRPYSGTIGKVAIYNEDLTTAELQALTENN